MLILGIETATELVGVALGNHEGVLASFEVTRGRRHAETLTPAIEFTCRQAGVELADLGCVAVDIGPGLFTGMRVGLAAAKALALALRIPMIGISSLDLLAFAASRNVEQGAAGAVAGAFVAGAFIEGVDGSGERIIVPVIDARKGEVFTAMYRTTPDGVQQVSSPAVGSVDDLIADLMSRGQPSLCVGDGAKRYRDEILDGYRCHIAEPVHPSARALVEMAHARALHEDWSDEVEPLYLRPPDAQISWATRESRP